MIITCNFNLRQNDALDIADSNSEHINDNRITLSENSERENVY